MCENHGALEGAVNKVTKSQKASRKNVSEFAHESVCRTHLRMLLEVLTDAKSGLLKRKSKSALFSAPGHVEESSNRTKINEPEGDEVYEVAPENKLASTFKGAF